MQFEFKSEISSVILNRFKICFLAALICAGHLFGQSPEALLDAGQQQWLAADFDSAYALFRAAQHEAVLQKDASSEANALFLAGKYLTRQFRLDEAAAALDSAIGMAAEVGWDHPGVILARRERATSFLFQGEMDSALRRYAALVEDCRELPAEKDSLLAMCLHAQGIGYSAISDWENSLNVSREALEIRKRIFHPLHITIGYSENSIGSALSWLDHYEESIKHYLEAEKILSHHQGESHPNLVQIRTNIGIHYIDMGLPWKALEYHKANLFYASELPPGPLLGVLLNLASTLVTVGDDVEALDVLEQAERVLDANPDMSAEHRAFIYGERGEIFRERGDYWEAREQINKVIEIETGLFGKNNFQLITSYYRKGMTALGEDVYPEAREAFQEALKLAELNGDEYSVFRGQSIDALGDVSFEEKKYDQALRTYRKALDVFIHSELTWYTVPIYNNMAVIWSERGQFDSCMHQHQLAWAEVLPEIPFQKNPDEQVLPYWPRKNLYEILVEQGNSLQLRFEQSKEINDLRASLNAYHMALAVADSQRAYYDSPESRQQGVQKHRKTAEAAIQLAFDLHQLTDELAYLEQAFLLAEKSKAGNLRDHLRSAQALQFAGIPDSLLEKERYFQQRLAALEALNYSEEVDSLQLAGAKELHFKLTQQYRRFLKKIEQEYPRYFQLKYPGASISLQAIEAKLAQDQALYSYFWGDSSLFVFQVFQGKLLGSQIKLTDDFDYYLGSWIKFVSFPPENNMWLLPFIANKSFEFKTQLLPSFSREIKQLVLIPDGLLAYLPFESLVMEPSNDSSWQSWDYLFDHSSCTYSNSLEVWLQGKAGSSSSKASYIGFAPGFDSEPIESFNRTVLGKLRYNQDEVKEAARIFKGKALMGDKAKESYLKAINSDPYIIHLATHAIPNEDDLMQSSIYLEGIHDTGEDGILHAYEIYNMRINSPLVVLSACETAIGRLEKGEGIMSLARAFQYSGAERVLSTLWQTDDRAGAEISKAFFAQLAEGQTVEVALQMARRQWLEKADNQFSHPYYWANYVLIGDGGHIPIKKPRPWAWVVFILLSTLTLSLTLIRRRRKSK